MDVKRKEKILSFQGLLAAPFTAFRGDGSVDIDIIRAYAVHLARSGVLGVFVNGTTGEGLSLTVKERKATAEAWVREGIQAGLELIVVHVGACALPDAQELARHAEAVGATAVASLPPLYYRSRDVDSLVDYFAALGSACPSLPLLLYYFPGMTGPDLPPPSAFLERCRDRLPQVVGAKFTSEDTRELARCLRVPGMKLMSGYDEALLPALVLGVTAAVGATFNFMADSSLKLISQVKTGDLDKARRTQQEIADITHIAGSAGYHPIAGFKALMNHRGPFSVGEPRRPLSPLTSEQRSWLAKALMRVTGAQ